ncbi:MAG: FkbM family methyltransferase [Halieaceae bacterium]|jgi:FkbM family methyltransferase|nr:FkbM family methyltransferase [Halieaceae bacterium]
MRTGLKRYFSQLLFMLSERTKAGAITGRPAHMSRVQYESLAALKCRIGYNMYGAYCLPESSLHRSAARRVLRSKVYEPQTIEFMRDNSRDGDIVHAGTYFGDFLPALSQGLAPGATLWAFEPNSENYSCAQITLLLNKLGNVRLTNAGLGAQDGMLAMRVNDDSGRALGGKSRIVSDQERNAECDEDVRIVTVDSAVGDEAIISIIQLDVEDHEQAALTGALRTIGRCSPILILEQRADSQFLDSEWFADNILCLGYEQTQTLHGNVVYQKSGPS